MVMIMMIVMEVIMMTVVMIMTIITEIEVIIMSTKWPVIQVDGECEGNAVVRFGVLSVASLAVVVRAGALWSRCWAMTGNSFREGMDSHLASV